MAILAMNFSGNTPANCAGHGQNWDVTAIRLTGKMPVPHTCDDPPLSGSHAKSGDHDPSGASERPVAGATTLEALKL